MTLACKLCGAIIKDTESMNEHRRNHHGWELSYHNQKDNVIGW